MPRSTMLKGSEVIGDHVFNSAGERLGKIEDLVVDAHRASVPYAIVSFDRNRDWLHAIPLSSLRPSLSGDHLVFAGDPSHMDQAPGFDRRNWPDMTDPAWRDRMHRSYPVAAPSTVIERREIRERDGRPDVPPHETVRAEAVYQQHRRPTKTVALHVERARPHRNAQKISVYWNDPPFCVAPQ